MVLCLLVLGLLSAISAPRQRGRRAAVDDRVYLVHSDVLKYDMYGPNPEAQIAKGHVEFRSEERV